MFLEKDDIFDYLLEMDDSIFYKELGITKLNYLSFYKDYLIRKDDQYYYRKQIDNDLLYNEIIGRYLCNKIKLNTTDLIISHKGFFTSEVLTPNYRVNTKVYYEPRDLYEDGMKTRTFDDKYFFFLDSSLQKDLFKLIAVDLMMEQSDRYARNLTVEVNNNKKRLAPIIDFEYSFNNDRKFTYFNPYVLINKDIRSLDRFYEKYKEGYRYLDTMFKITAGELIDYIKDEYDLKVNRLVKKDLYCTTRRNNNIIDRLNG